MKEKVLHPMISSLDMKSKKDFLDKIVHERKIEIIELEIY
jgi:hypothetical protein